MIYRNTLYAPPKVGGDIVCYCTKCKLSLAHVIIAMVDGKIAKVICKTCKSQHKYRGTIKLSTTPKTTDEPKWKEKVDPNKPAVPYVQNHLFKEGELINHPSFGIGIVEEAKKNKIIVLFKTGKRVLVHGT